MKTLANPADLETISLRLSRLTEQDTALWGSMSVHQTVCHLTDSYQTALGQRPVKPASSFFRRTLMKWFALHAPVPWPKGVPTLPEVEQGKGGSPPVDFIQDRAALLQIVEGFCANLPSRCVPHAIFGSMTAADWMRWGYLHADHHLRQFDR